MDRPKTSSWRVSLTPYLTNIAQASAPFLTTFLMVHLSAPIVANLGGSSLSSQVMLLGREYYQTTFGERYLLLTPLFVHVGAASLKRIVAPRPPRSWTSILTLTGYAAALVLLPIHYLTHRIYPTDLTPAISSVGPSELDYEFVKTALHTWPVRSTLLYVALVGGLALHASEGMQVMLTHVVAGARGLSRRARRVIAAGAVVPVLTGLLILAREPLLAFGPMASRYRAAMIQSFVFRF
ncbi:hypothetical protein OF83DRAFT_689318 [Amylostereum chailletii]|nr:hypothetical protein OF83DRAFT_689318 [Amylostereum chailletii]